MAHFDGELDRFAVAAARTLDVKDEVARTVDQFNKECAAFRQGWKDRFDQTCHLLNQVYSVYIIPCFHILPLLTLSLQSFLDCKVS